jgi:hypothetical protein
MQVGLSPFSGGGIPFFQQAADSVRLYASEWDHAAMAAAEPTMPGSDQEPARYVWSSSNPQVAEMRPSGWLITHAPGKTTISVRGGGSRFSQVVVVCSRETQLRIGPRDPILAMHDTVTLTFTLIQPGGAACGVVNLAPFAPTPWEPNGPLEQVFNQTNRWRATRLGSRWYASYAPFAQRMLRDSILVTVK